MVTNAQMTPTQQRIINAKKERDAKWAAAAKAKEQERETAKVLQFVQPVIKKIEPDSPRVVINRYREHMKDRCAKWHIDYDDLMGDGQSRTLTFARQILAWELKEMGVSTWGELARYMGCDHTTCIYSVRKINEIGVEKAEEQLHEHRLASMRANKRSKKVVLLTAEHYDKVLELLKHGRGSNYKYHIAVEVGISEHQVRRIASGSTKRPAR